MTRIYLIRHAEAEGNLYRRVHGWYDSLITERGYRQIDALRERFRDIPIDAVYSSDLFRTKTTASSVYAAKGLELRIRKDLREVNMGDWEDKPWGEVERSDGERLALFNQSSPRWQAPHGESYEQVRQRLAGAIFRIARQHPHQTVAIFSHGSALRTVLASFQGLPPERLCEAPHCDNTAVSCIEVNGEQAGIVFLNDNSHLDATISTFARQKWWREGARPGADVNLWYRPLDFERESEVYYQYRKEAWVTIHGSLLHFDGEGFLRDARAQANWDERSVMLAMAGDQPAGLLQMDTRRDAEKGVGGIPFYYMTPGFRSQGLGIQLLGQAVSTYRSMGRTYLRLRCAPDNTVAQAFYQSHGFHKIAEEQGSRVPLDIMEKYIGFEPRAGYGREGALAP